MSGNVQHQDALKDIGVLTVEEVEKLLHINLILPSKKLKSKKKVEFMYIGRSTKSIEPGFCSLLAMQKVKGERSKRGFVNVERISDGAKFRIHMADLIPKMEEIKNKRL